MSVVIAPTRKWVENKNETTTVQISDLYMQPDEDQIVKVKHDSKLTLVFLRDRFKIKEEKDKRIVDESILLL